MTRPSLETVFQELVELTCTFLALSRSMDIHAEAKVLPHLDEPARQIVRNLIGHIRAENSLDRDLLNHLDGTISEIRNAVAAGKVVTQVPIPRAQLIGCSEAFETHVSYSSAARALQVALPPIERLQQVALAALDHAQAIRLSLDLIDME